MSAESIALRIVCVVLGAVLLVVSLQLVTNLRRALTEGMVYGGRIPVARPIRRQSNPIVFWVSIAINGVLVCLVALGGIAFVVGGLLDL